jgi:hypothetical protein
VEQHLDGVRGRRLAGAAVLTLFGALAVSAPAASAHESAAGSHRSIDTVRLSPARQAQLVQRAAQLTALSAEAVTPGTEHLVGTWEAPRDWSIVGVFLSLLPNGKVLAFDSVNDQPAETNQVHTTTRALVWDPATNTNVRYDNTTGFNLFCSGYAKLPDGRVFLAGGNKDAALSGLRTTHLFDFASNTWTRTADMASERWYPSVTPLRNGEMLVTGGGPATSEVRETDGRLRPLTSASRPEWANREYPWLQTAPNGQVAFIGPNPSMGYVDTTAAGTWTPIGQRSGGYRSYGSYAMFDAINGRVLVSGGADTNRSAEVVDLNTNSSAPTSPMNVQRRQHNLTVLPNGSVLATGGIAGSGGSLADFNNAVLGSEIWNPSTGQWTATAAQARPRMYHSAALLLPDGRVLSTGGGICGTCAQIGYLEKNYEIYTPPYLYQTDGSLAPRPQITAAPATINYSSAFAVGSPQAATITKAALVRLGSVTHSQDMEQRYVPLTFSASGSTLTVNGPANANVAPPGYYMLFLLDSAGVPSVAKIVNLPVAPPVAPGVGGGSGLSGSYFGNVGLSGAALVTRTEGVNFSWGTVAPAVGVPADGYSVRWSGTVEAPLSGTYRLQTISDDGVRVTFNGARVIDNWTYHGPATDTAAPVTLVAGTKYPITIEYFEGSQGATARLLWQTPWAPTTFTPIPTDRLYTP